MNKAIEQIKEHLGKKNLHHAYLIIGSAQELRTDLLSVIDLILGTPAQGSPDFWHHKTTLFGITDSQDLRLRQSQAAFGNVRCFLIEATSFSTDAEDALLKTLEEPAPNTHFFIIFHDKELLLPTLLSRMFVLSSEISDEREEAKNFLEGDVAYRLKYIDKLFCKKTSTPEEKRELKRKFSKFVSDVEREFHKEVVPDLNSRGAYRALQKVTKYLNDSGATSELIGEFISLTLPTINLSVNKSLL